LNPLGATSGEMSGNINIHPEKNRGKFLSEEIRNLCGVDINTCLQCRTCASVCPFYEAMENAPHTLFRKIQYGLREEVLTSSAIWICVGCNTCASQCPAMIDIVAVMDALRHLALEEDIRIPEEDILNFHREVLNSIERYGRTHKLEIMLRYKIKSRHLFSDLDTGVVMLARRKLDLRPSRVHSAKEIKRLFKKAWQKT
jgi:heterodisulfide reductase subunit C